MAYTNVNVGGRPFGLDFETYCDLDLKKVGLDRYINHPSFKVLCASIYDHENNSTQELDMIVDPVTAMQQLALRLRLIVDGGNYIVAHNAGFERAVLRRVHIAERIQRAVVDSAVVARQLGAASKLALAAPQLTGGNKMEEGLALIKLFSVPNKLFGMVAPTMAAIKNAGKLKEWRLFKDYCSVDARLGVMVWLVGLTEFPEPIKQEVRYEQLTALQNERGWPVDADALNVFSAQYALNCDELIEWIHLVDPSTQQLNLGSSMQLAAWCKERGVRATSFDEEHVAELAIKLQRKIDTMSGGEPRYKDYSDVVRMLHVKQDLGGSSLRKLETIERLTHEDGRLRHQYMHVGAGQSYRSSGRGAQLQNLPRLVGQIDMDTVLDGRYNPNNTVLSNNIRQLFKPEGKGAFVVGDFSSVESRGLAWLAGEQWKLDAYRKGLDLYKVLASSIYNVVYDQVDKTQRQTGKVGELSCGYGAGSGAVVSFAKGMGIEMSEPDAGQLVYDWRRANPNVTRMWELLDAGLKGVVQVGGTSQAIYLASGAVMVHFRVITTPSSLRAQHPGAKSVAMTMSTRNGILILERVFHGCYMAGNSVQFYKAGEAINGALWRDGYRDPKTGQFKKYKLYGGKLTGILVQSFCRELFFDRMLTLESWCSNNVSKWKLSLIGQFHDELVVEVPEAQVNDIDHIVVSIRAIMADAPPWAPGFPLDAEVKWDHRYTK